MKKKGFTLIELLATIIILAIIALLASPIALNIIDSARKKANRETVNGIIVAGENYYADSWFDKDKKYNVENSIDVYEEIEVGGRKPKTGYLALNEHGKVGIAVLIDGTCYMKQMYEDIVMEFESDEEECYLDFSGIDKESPSFSFEIVGIINEKGWYVQTPSIKLNITDTESGFENYYWCVGVDCEPNNVETNASASITVPDTNETQVCAIVYDKAGNTSGKLCTDKIKIDTVAPEISGIADISVQLNEQVDLLKGVEATDATSGIEGDIVIEPSSVDTKKSGTYPVKYTVYDKAGNKKEVTRNVIVAGSGPVITFTPDENAINSNGWANKDFYVTVNITDNTGHGIRGFKICTATTDTCDLKDVDEQSGTSTTRLIAAESNNNRICVQATDNSGQTSEKCSDAYKLDKTKPTAGTIKVNGSTTIKDWYNENVTIETVDGTDGLSGHLSTTSNITSVTSNTEGTAVIVTTKDKAGNESTSEYTIKVDKTAPVITITEPTIDGTDGWYKTKPSITIKVTDDTSKLDSYKWCMGIGCEPTDDLDSANKTVTINDTEGTQICVIANDKAGNTSGKVCSNILKVDTVLPEISGIEDIYASVGEIVDLQSGVIVTDTTSKIKGTYSYSPTIVDTSFTNTVPVKYTVYDNAGNKKEVTRNVIVSAPGPVIAFTPDEGAINNNGWAKEDFYVTVNIRDTSGHGIRGYKICTATTDTCDLKDVDEQSGNSTTRLIAIESSNNRFCVEATDNAGQTSERCSDAYKLDKTKPTAGTIKVNGSTEIKDWYKENVTIETVDGTDSLSGHLSTTSNITSITSNTEGTAVIVTTMDKAGNVSTSNYEIKVDKNQPVCSFEALNYVGINKTATVSMTCTNDLSGMSNVTLTKDDFTISNSNIKITSVGKANTTNGYKYTITVEGVTDGTSTITLPANKLTTIAGQGNNAKTSGTITITKISLSSTSGVLYTNGNSATVTISGSNYGTANCSSSNTAYATCSVSGDTLTIKPGANVGQATITVTGTNGNPTVTYTADVQSATYAATPSYSCSSGTPIGTNGENCKLTISSESYRYCSSGTENSYGTCDVTKYEDPINETIYDCDNYPGYTLDGTKCKKEIIASKITNDNYTCPTGYTPTGEVTSSTTCSKEVDASYAATGTISKDKSCDFGDSSITPCDNWDYSSSHHHCIKDYGMASCPSGYQLSGVQCVAKTPRYVIGTGCSNCIPGPCPSGYMQKGSSCYHISTPTCSQGSLFEGNEYDDDNFLGHCYTTLSAKTVYSCPNGGNLNGTICEKTDTLTSSPNKTTTSSCPSDYLENSNGTCVKIDIKDANSTIKRCERGTYNGYMCVYSSTISKTTGYRCPSGYTPTGNVTSTTICTKTVSANVTYSCPYGGELLGSTCTRK